MIKIVIADDEEKVCQLICSLIDWGSMDMGIVGTAQNGIEALEMVRTLSPDVLITDIRMPGVDGLEMIRRARELKRGLEFIIISGYQHFKYAQDAIKYGVSDYLLKPIKKEDLLLSLKRVQTLYDQRNEQAGKERQLEEQLKDGSEKLRRNLFLVLLEGKNDRGGMTLEAVNQTYRYSFQPGRFLVCGIKIDCGCGNEYDGAVRMLQEKAVQILIHTMKGKCHDLETCPGNSIVWSILNYAPQNENDIRRGLKALLDELLLQKSAFEGFQFTVGAGLAEPDVGRLPESCLSARRAVYQRLLIGSDRLITASGSPVPRENADALLAELDQRLGPAIELLDRESTSSCLDGLARKLTQEKTLNGEQVFYVASQIFLMYLIHQRTNQVSVGNTESLKKDFLTYAGRCGSAEELFRYLSHLISESIRKILEEKKQMEAKPIRQAKQYIRLNFKNSITLEEVSGTVGFSPAYFSTLFKKETGSNFVDYLTIVRMDETKRLLRETDLSISSVCEEVGYSDRKNFAKNFKRYTGLKPNEYRKLYS